MLNSHLCRGIKTNFIDYDHTNDEDVDDDVIDNDNEDDNDEE